MAAERNLPDVQVRMHNGKPTVFIDGEPDALPGYCSFYTPNFFERYMPPLYEHNISLFHIAYRALPDDRCSSLFWVGDKIDSVPVVEVPPDFFGMDRQAELIINGDPDAYLIIRFRHAPPESWIKLHPQEMFINEEGGFDSHFTTPSFASDLFWDSASNFCTSLIEYVESRPWANRVIGYLNIHINEGVLAPAFEGWMYDHNPLMIERWREFLKSKYGTEKQLRAAYGDQSLSFETMDVPKEELHGSVPEVSSLLYWQNAEDNRALRDYLELQRDLWHLRFRQIAAAMKKGTDRNVLLMHDVLKQPMLGWNLRGFFAHRPQWRNIGWNFAYPELMAGSGHMNVAKLFDVEGFTGLLTPHDYQVRGTGGVYEPEGILDSGVLRGQFSMCEMDTRFSSEVEVGVSSGLGAARDEKEFAAITWRNYAASLTRGFNSYLHHAWTVDDWFLSENVQKMIKRQAEVISESVNWEHETVPGIAMVIDDASVLETNGSGNYFNEAIMWEYKMGLARCGVPYRIYLLEDLALDDFPEHRVFYFPNLFAVTDEKMELLQGKVFRNGNVVVWGPGSGISDGEHIGTESAERLTGLAFEMLPANCPRRVIISNFDHPITRDLDEALVFGSPLAYGPLLLPKGGTALGRIWTKGGTNHSGMSLLEFGKGAAGGYRGSESLGAGDYASIFMTAVPIPAALWKNIARFAGVHIYTETNDILLADKSVVALHSLKSGEKCIKLPGRYDVRDIISGKVYAEQTDEIRFTLDAPDTRMFLVR